MRQARRQRWGIGSIQCYAVLDCATKANRGQQRGDLAHGPSVVAERAPFGWRGEPPYLPFPPEAAERNVEAQRADPESIAHLYRDLIAVRRASPALSGGDWKPVEAPKDVIGFRRSAAGDQRVILVNFAGHAEEIPVDGGWVVELASDRAGEGEKYGGLVPGDAAVILRPS